MIAHFSGYQAHLLIFTPVNEICSYRQKKVDSEAELPVILERASSVPCIRVGSQVLLSVSVKGRWCDSRKQQHVMVHLGQWDHCSLIESPT